MKRLVTLGITLALVMGLFCFSVNAETVIQGTSDTVTATYGSNDITIALKARKLRVVNTGTAAAGYAGYTPVIVTITIYNLGNQNCLINNLKFQLSSNSAESTIAGYENLSTDLFLADSAYDSNGYLSIHASNDYTYSGGIVCPANTNMTYVGIINVSANWITENQTWRTVDLSSANFYTNLTTTVGDYHCAAEPVDLSEVNNLLNDILTAAQGTDLDVSSIRSLLTDMVDDIIYTGQNFQYTSSVVKSDSITVNSHTFADTTISLRTRILRNFGRPYLINSVVQEDAVNDTLNTVNTIRYPFVITYITQNGNSKDIYCSNINRIDYIFPTNISISNIHLTNFQSTVYQEVYFEQNVTYFVNNNTVDYWYSYIPKGTTVTVLRGYIDLMDNINPSFNDMSVTYWNNGANRFRLENSGYGYNEYLILRDLYLAYSSVNGINDLSEAASDAADQAANIHNQEASYYAQNQAAIEATGLSNYQFSGEQSNGIGAVSNDFTALWNALGSWNSVYIFSMTLTLALTILRHVPNRRKPKEKNSE